MRRNRRNEIIQALADLSKNGWANARPCDYEPLEKELREIDRRYGLRTKLQPLERNPWLKTHG